MDLFLIRHGDAVPLGEQGINADEDRPLTERGKSQARVLALGLPRRGIRPALLLTSPLVRARQTAEEMLKHWPPPAPELQICEELVPGCKRRKLARTIEATKGDRIALMGHQPDLGEFAAWLVGGKNALIDFAKGGAAFIHCEGNPRKGAGTLLWLVTPEWLADGLDVPLTR
jgi:phosphohistidine phosphatase